MALDKIRIRGGNPLKGEIEVSGAKNAALPLLAASLLTEGMCRVRGVPELQDVGTMLGILRILGVRVDSAEGSLIVDAGRLTGEEAPYEAVRKMRASVLLLGPLLARAGHARVSLPGGCAIGVRPIDQHLKVLDALGAQIRLSDGYVEARARRLRGGKYSFDLVTVTGTANAMMAGALAEGETRLANCAREPEVVFLAETLRSMGAEIAGEGTSEITVRGVRELTGYDVTLIPDRIEAGTYLVAGALTGGDVFLRGARADHLEAVIGALSEAGALVDESPEGIRVRAEGRPRAMKLRTAPYPGFPTDMQAQFTVLLSLAGGNSRVRETIFENRFMHVAELCRMGARLKIRGSTVAIEGVEHLNGTSLMATDLRASASLVLAGLVARGTTEVSRIYHLDRGYESMECKLRSLGADVVRVLDGNGVA